MVLDECLFFGDICVVMIMEDQVRFMGRLHFSLGGEGWINLWVDYDSLGVEHMGG